MYWVASSFVGAGSNLGAVGVASASLLYGKSMDVIPVGADKK